MLTAGLWICHQQKKPQEDCFPNASELSQWVNNSFGLGARPIPLNTPFFFSDGEANCLLPVAAHLLPEQNQTTPNHHLVLAQASVLTQLHFVSHVWEKPWENTYNWKGSRENCSVCTLHRLCRLAAHAPISHAWDGVARRRALHVTPDLLPACLIPCKHRISRVCISGALLEQRESSGAAIPLPHPWLKTSGWKLVS